MSQLKPMLHPAVVVIWLLLSLDVVELLPSQLALNSPQRRG
jgi:hypothetical protein